MTGDLISRADAIRIASGFCHPSNIAKELAKLPSAEPIVHKSEKDTDLISKKDTLAKFDPVSDWSAYQIIKGMPSAEKTGRWIAIKDFNMPSCCNNCQMYDGMCCCITLTECEDELSYRNDDCPLIEEGETEHETQGGKN